MLPTSDKLTWLSFLINVCTEKKIIDDEKPVTVMGRMILKLKVEEGDNS